MMPLHSEAAVTRDMRKPESERKLQPFLIRTSQVLDRRAGLIALFLVIIATLRIVSTYTVFSHTFDEPMHLACGMEWLDRGTYTCEPQHPPLARISAALGPYLSGIRSQGVATTDIYSQPLEGIAILYAGNHYDRTLALSRLGLLPFFWVACAVVYCWGLRIGRSVALASLLLFTLLPPVLAHAGLATTDMALTAFVGAAFLGGLRWAESPSVRTAIAFGTFTGLAVLSKFSSLLFLPASFAVALLVSWAAGASHNYFTRQHTRTAALAIALGAVVIWAGYRFSVGWSEQLGMVAPAPELAAGIAAVSKHNSVGHWSYLLGQHSPVGFWYFYPIAIAVKTPLPVLLLLAIGVVLMCRTEDARSQLWLPLVFSAAILQAGMLGHINIGIRHILPVYIGMALVAGAVTVRCVAHGGKITITCLILLTWLLWSSARIHPDYIAYFNETVFEHPENVLVDSDLDWGQDIKRLGARLRELHAQTVTFPQFIVADLEKQGFPPVIQKADVIHLPAEGYFAAGATFWKSLRFGLVAEGDQPIWPDSVAPTERIGKGIFLWHFRSGQALPPK
jgi:hypothetical protein